MEPKQVLLKIQSSEGFPIKSSATGGYRGIQKVIGGSQRLFDFQITKHSLLSLSKQVDSVAIVCIFVPLTESVNLCTDMQEHLNFILLCSLLELTYKVADKISH